MVFNSVVKTKRYKLTEHRTKYVKAAAASQQCSLNMDFPFRRHIIHTQCQSRAEQSSAPARCGLIMYHRYNCFAMLQSGYIIQNR